MKKTLIILTQTHASTELHIFDFLALSFFLNIAFLTFIQLQIMTWVLKKSSNGSCWFVVEMLLCILFSPV